MPACLRPWRVGLFSLSALLLSSVGCTTDFDLGSLRYPDAGADAAGDLGDSPRVDAPDDVTDVGEDVPPPPPPPPDGGCGQANQLCCASDGGTAVCGPSLICTGGACLRCPTILSACNGACVDFQVNPRYCGNCETRCAAGEVCTGGTCVLPCPPGQAQCGSACVQIASDVAHCGMCDHACPLPAGAASQCMSGICQAGACNPGYANCDGITDNGCETVLANSVAHCGVCGNSCTFAHATASCVAGGCVMGACEPGYGDCDMNPANGCEVNTATSISHCGVCNMACAVPAKGSPVCRMGVCGEGLTTCEPGTGDCDGNIAGCETNLSTSTNNCGACGALCSFAHAAVSCATGGCVMGACDGGFGNCDGDPTNGCETDLRSSATHCGTCGTSCAAAHGAAECAIGVCRLGACEAGFANCDMNASNGCEADLNSSAENCGGCGVLCAIPNAMSTCTAGACRLVSCNAGFADCDGNPANGCEVALMTDASNCGACRSVCNSAHATPTCSAGACAPVCEMGYGNCDMNPANGCEADLRNDPVHCGACSPPCSFPHASPLCMTGTCAMGACDAGFANCDGNPVNGCEVDLSSDPVHCGTCTTTCASGQLCAAGRCTVSCGAGLTACDASCVDLQSNASNCGACGTVCATGPNATAKCEMGRCSLTCAMGFADCDGVASNGCEVTTATNTLNCGGCGRACAAANAVSTCAASSCGFTCNPGFGNCDGTSSNGCETVTSNSPTNCGGCGNTCSARANATAVCTSGGCGFVCNTGFGDCDGVATNGCEVALTTVTNCGACGTRCGAPNAMTSCTAGVCAMGACIAGYGNCDGIATNGCETRLNVAERCGSCTTVCPTGANGRATCNGTSTLTCGTACYNGFSHCSSDPVGACSTNLRTTTRCGGCSSTSCSGGSPLCRSNVSSTATGSIGCGNSCPGGTSLCASTSQCVNLQTDPANCGSCGTVCPSGPHSIPACVAGSCRLTCVDSFNNCDGVASNGCESNSLRDSSNCVTCGSACSSGFFCSSGRCCLNGQLNCSAGCTDPRTDDNNCGGCGTVCSGGRHCVNYACTL